MIRVEGIKTRGELEERLREIAYRKEIERKHNELIKYRNHLQSIIVCLEKDTIEYRNIQNRIYFAHNKAYRLINEHFPIAYKH